MVNIIHRIGIKANPQDVYKALTTNEGLSTWWTTDTSGAGSVGSIIEFRFGGGGPDFEVVELQTDSLVRWKHSGEMPEAWMGTEVSFKLYPSDNQTLVLFSHSDWQGPSDFMAHCSTKWAMFLMSLKAALEKGKGNPFPNDVPIDYD